MRKLLISIALLCSAAFVAGAQQEAASGVAMGFSAIPRDVKTLGIGGQDAVRNISVRPFEEQKFDANVSYAMWAPKSTVKSNDFNASVYGKIIDKIGVMVSASYDGGSSYSIYNDEGKAGETYNPSAFLLNAGVSYKITNFLCLGAGVKYMSENLAPEAKYSSVAADVYLTYGGNGFVITAGASNLGGKVKANDGTAFSLPSAATLAGNYNFSLAEKHKLLASAQMNYFFVGGFRAAVGACYAFNDLVFVRAGYNYGGKSIIPSYASAGVGVKVKGFSFDAAMLFGSGNINTTLQLGIGYCF